MRELCQKCHVYKDTLIICKRCKLKVCLACFYTKEGLCCDCLVDHYNEINKGKYDGKINETAKT